MHKRFCRYTLESFLHVLAGWGSWFCPPEPMGQMHGEARQGTVSSAVCIVCLTYIYPAVRSFPKALRKSWGREVLGRKEGAAWPLCRCQIWAYPLSGCLSAGSFLALRHQVQDLFPRRRQLRIEGPQVLSGSFSS